MVLSASGVAAVLGVGAWQVARLLGDDDGDRRAAEVFAASWSAGEVDGLADVTAGLTPADGDRPSGVSVAAVRRDGDRATAVLDVRWQLGAPWTYRTQLPLRRTGEQWRPVVTPGGRPPRPRRRRGLRSRLVQAPARADHRPRRAPRSCRTGRS
jgi:hypothetical protein